MADGAEPPALNERERFEQVESADIVPDGLHRAALVAERFEIGIVAGQQRIRRRQADVAAPGEFDAIFVVRTVAQADDDFLAERMGLVQTEDRGRFASAFGVEYRLGNEQIRRHARAWFGGISEEASNVVAAVHFLL